MAVVEDFWVNLADLQSAAGVVRTQHDVIQGQIAKIKGHFAAIERAWVGPAGQSFQPLEKDFTPAMDNLCELLAEAARRMDDAYGIYLQAEQANHDGLQGMDDNLPG